MFYNSEQFEFVSLLEANWRSIQQELNQLQQQDFIPWPEKYLYGQGWDTFGIYAFGLKIPANSKLCPETTRLLEKIPGLVTAGFSSLAPGTHITPHTGYADGVLRCHLGLVVPESCAIRVGPETRPWVEGKCLVFDDTTEHEAWNQGTITRIVLLLDFKPAKGVIQAPVAVPSTAPSTAPGAASQKPEAPSLVGFLKKFVPRF